MLLPSSTVMDPRNQRIARLDCLPVFSGETESLRRLAVAASLFAGVMTLHHVSVTIGCILLVGGCILFVLPAAVAVLKDIRFNSRQILLSRRRAVANFSGKQDRKTKCAAYTDIGT